MRPPTGNTVQTDAENAMLEGLIVSDFAEADMATFKDGKFKISINHRDVQQYRRGIEDSKRAFQTLMGLTNQTLNRKLPKVKKGSQELGGPKAYVGGKKQHGSFERRYMSFHMIYRKEAPRGDKPTSIVLMFNPKGQLTRTGRRNVPTVHKAIQHGSKYRPSSRGYPGRYRARPMDNRLMKFVKEKTQPAIRELLRAEIDKIKRRRNM